MTERSNEEWPEVDFATAKRMWGAGHKTAEIARALGRSRGAVMGKMRRRRADFPRRSAEAREVGVKGSRWSDADIRWAKALRVEGLSAVDIARRMGRDPSSVSKYLRRMGLGTGATERSRLGFAAAGGSTKSSPLEPTIAVSLIADPVPYPPGPFQCRVLATPDDLPATEVGRLAKEGSLTCCGKPVAVRRDGTPTPYCTVHLRLFYRPAQRLSPAAAVKTVRHLTLTERMVDAAE